MSTDPAYDLCVVGAGPAGLSVALASARRGLRVVLLEAGGLTPRERRLPEIDIADPARHAPPQITNCQALGGAAWLWGGRCVPFDPIDLAARPHLPQARWPIGVQDLQPWMQPAVDFLGAGEDRFAADDAALAGLDGVDTRALERWSMQPNLADRHREALSQPGLQVRLNTAVTGLAVSQGHVAGLSVRAAEGAEETITASRYVIAGGGLETTRLLLAAQRRDPGLFGGEGGPLGRFYMGHLSGQIADLRLEDARDIDAFDFHLDGGAFVRRRLTLTAGVQLREALCNIAFWPDNPPFHDPAHGSGALSMVYLALRTPGLGRRLLPEAVRLAHTGSGPLRLGRHLANAARTPVKTVRDLAAIARQRLIERPRRPGFLVRTRSNAYALHYHAEQSPNAESRIRLASGGEDVGRLRVDLQFTEADALSVLRAHEILDGGLRRAGRGALHYRVDEAGRLASVLAQASDGFHQIGSTRMGEDRRFSVVDPDCRVHDVDNLYLASSSVFPSSSQANPTLMTVVLALRLADHLAATQTS